MTDAPAPHRRPPPLAATTARASPAGGRAAASRYRDADGRPVRDPRDPGADPGARDPAGLDRRLDLPARRTATSRRPAATRAAASSTATTPATARRRDAAKFERLIAFARRPAGDPRAGRPRPGPAGPAPREGPRRGRPAARADPDPGRQRRVRPAEPVVRADDAARPARGGRRRREIRFRFRGKSGKQHEVGLRDRRLAAVVRRCRDLPGPGAVPVRRRGRRAARRRVRRRQRLSRARSRRASRRRTSGPGPGPSSPTARCARSGKGATDREKQRNVAEAIRPTADNLGNTPAVARQAYVHPAVVDAYLDGRIRSALVQAAEDDDAAPGATDARRGAGRRGAAPGAPPRGRGPGAEAAVRSRSPGVAGASPASSSAARRRSSAAGAPAGRSRARARRPARFSAQARPPMASMAWRTTKSSRPITASRPSSPWTAARRRSPSSSSGQRPRLVEDADRDLVAVGSTSSRAVRSICRARLRAADEREDQVPDRPARRRSNRRGRAAMGREG